MSLDLQLTIGTKHSFNTPLEISMGGAFQKIDAIFPLCMTKTSFVINSPEKTMNILSTGDCIIPRMIYDLDNYYLLRLFLSGSFECMCPRTDIFYIYIVSLFGTGCLSSIDFYCGASCSAFGNVNCGCNIIRNGYSH